jgi:hypothetical protein
MEVTATKSFVHGSLWLHKGDTADVPDQTAKELQIAGLVDLDGDPGLEVKQAPVAQNKMATDHYNKASNKAAPDSDSKKS